MQNLRPSLGWLGYALLLVLGAALDILCRYFPAHLPFLLPWEFSWPVFLAVALPLGWYFRGLARLVPAARPAWWRTLLFVAGIAAIYVPLQTHMDYYAQHMFFIHRFQHLGLHHLGPFLIALGAAGPVIRVGMPAFLRPLVAARPVRRTVDVIQNPVVAPVLFVGLIYFWLIPGIHDRVMLDVDLYNTMNWSMAVDGLFFWCLVLDQRPKPPARLSSGVRALLTIAVVPPQILVGALIALSGRDLYPVYRICGRFMDISALADQHYGGLILWIPSSMMSVIALILALNTMRLNEEAAERLARAQ